MNTELLGERSECYLCALPPDIPPAKDILIHLICPGRIVEAILYVFFDARKATKAQKGENGCSSRSKKIESGQFVTGYKKGPFQRFGR